MEKVSEVEKKILHGPKNKATSFSSADNPFFLSKNISHFSLSPDPTPLRLWFFPRPVA